MRVCRVGSVEGAKEWKRGGMGDGIMMGAGGWTAAGAVIEVRVRDFDATGASKVGET